VLGRLHADILSSIHAPEVRTRIDELAMSVIANTPAEFSAMLKTGIDQYGRLIKAAGIQPE
jgi:tripartite-type tricarboxylate transporter receptor subunit TctC